MTVQELADRRKGCFAKVLERIPFAGNLGFEVDAVQQGAVTLTMPRVAVQHTNYLGAVHGGVMMSLADTAMGLACASQGYVPATIEMNINFIKSVSAPGAIRATAVILHHGRQTMVAEAALYRQDGELVAKARGTFFIMEYFDEARFSSLSDTASPAG